MEQVAWHSSARISSTPSKPIKTRDTCPLDRPATNYLPPHAHFKTSLRNPARSNQAPHIQFIFGPSNPLTQTTRRSKQEGLPNPLFDTRFDVPRVFATRGLVAPYRTPRAPPPSVTRKALPALKHLRSSASIYTRGGGRYYPHRRQYCFRQLHIAVMGTKTTLGSIVLFAGVVENHRWKFFLIRGAVALHIVRSVFGMGFVR